MLVPIVISSGEFQPMVIALRRDRPYRLMIQNYDDATRVFNAPAFLAEATIASFQVDGEDRGPGCIGQVIVPPRATAEVHLRPRRAGRFPVAESFVPVGYWGTGIAAIYVE
jgi:hypothetical protein